MLATLGLCRRPSAPSARLPPSKPHSRARAPGRPLRRPPVQSCRSGYSRRSGVLQWHSSGPLAWQALHRVARDEARGRNGDPQGGDEHAMEDDDVAGRCAALCTQHSAMPLAAGAPLPSRRILPRRSIVLPLRAAVATCRRSVATCRRWPQQRGGDRSQVPQRQTQGRWPKEYDNNPAYFSPSGGFGPPNADGYRPIIADYNRL